MNNTEKTKALNAEKIEKLDERRELITELLSLKENPAIARLTSMVQQSVIQIDILMRDNCKDVIQDGKPVSVRLTEADRLKMESERAVWLWFIGVFPEAERSLEIINKKIDRFRK